MDRKFGGNLDFLVTDVSTGDRGEGIGSEAGKADFKPAVFSAVFDEAGVHFLMRAYDDKARAVEANLEKSGSYEIYLAPGDNQPYYCILPRHAIPSRHTWQTTYDTALHHRISWENGGYRQDHRFLEDGYATYLFLDWKYFYDKLPDDGDTWEFESIHWSRAGGFSWNGTKSIHGRSTWGRLVFRMTPEALVKIKRRIIFAALEHFKRELVTDARIHGAVKIWLDPVLGDPEFYNTHVKPLREHLESYIPLVRIDMSDEDVETVFREAVPGWYRIEFLVAELRRRYLEEQFSR